MRIGKYGKMRSKPENTCQRSPIRSSLGAYRHTWPIIQNDLNYPIEELMVFKRQTNDV
jgi:hypothetical protein